MRMLMVVPMMAVLSPIICPTALKDIRLLFQPQYHAVLWQTLGCGVLMFVYVACFYISLGLIPAGISTTLFFVYPVFTVLFSWKLTGDRPTRFRWLVMAIILLGSALAMPHSSAVVADAGVTLGVVTAIGAGMIYALYTVIAQKCFAVIPPLPFTWISFAMTLLLSSLCLLFWQTHPEPIPWTPLWIGGLLSGVISFTGHALTNVGIQMVGASTAAIVSSTSPALTTLLAWSSIGEALNLVQLFGILIVTLGIVLLSGERRFRERPDPWGDGGAEQPRRFPGDSR